MTTTPGTAAGDRGLQAGAHVGEYVVESLIGAGGFGTVYRARHPLIGKLAAVKVLSRQYSADPEIVSRFVDEARAVNQIRHRNIIDIFSFGQLDDDRSFYVMELLDGQPLDEVIEQRGALPLGEAIPILRGIARALDAAHASGVAHRDLKPENIFLARDSDGGVFPKLLDFGIALLLGDRAAEQQHKTRTGAPMGTPFYMSPEQCRGRDVDHRTDFYAFGCVAYKLLTGDVPFDGEAHMDVLMKQIGEEPDADLRRGGAGRGGGRGDRSGGDERRRGRAGRGGARARGAGGASAGAGAGRPAAVRAGLAHGRRHRGRGPAAGHRGLRSARPAGRGATPA